MGAVGRERHDRFGGAPRAAAGGLPVYFDYQATTPVDPRVLREMLPWFSENFGNPGSLTHALGREAAQAVERARGELAALIGAEPREIVFTSGATEANTLAIKGAAHFNRAFGKDGLVTVAIEHKCVLESCRALERESTRSGLGIFRCSRQRSRFGVGNGGPQRNRRPAADR
jgi:selenocysteine lyase/cysteine desulfurase